jgi:hypothetical protein
VCPECTGRTESHEPAARHHDVVREPNLEPEPEGPAPSPPSCRDSSPPPPIVASSSSDVKVGNVVHNIPHLDGEASGVASEKARADDDIDASSSACVFGSQVSEKPVLLLADVRQLLTAQLPRNPTNDINKCVVDFEASLGDERATLEAMISQLYKDPDCTPYTG